jgi:hypothetical protein
MAKKSPLSTWDNHGSVGSYDWVEGIEYKLYLPIGIRQIYDFWLYTKIAKYAPQDVLVKMQEDRKTRGLSKSVQSALSACHMKRYNAQREQEKYCDQLLMQAETDKIMEYYDITSGRLDEQIKEAERCKNLTDEQRSLREQPYNTNNIPLSEFQTQPVIEEKTFSKGVTYRIYEKKYQNYAAVVYSPSRVRADGTQGVVYIVDPDIVELKIMVEDTVEEEKYLQVEFEQAQKKAALKATTVNRAQTTKKNVNIDHVKKAMGIDKNRFGSDLDGNIF